MTRVWAKLLTMKSRYAGRWARIHTLPAQKAAVEKAVHEIFEELTSPEAVADRAADDGRRRPRVRAVSRNRASGRRPLNRPEAENEVVPKQAAVNRDRPPAPRSHSDPIIEMVRTFLILVLAACLRGENPLQPTKNKTHSDSLKWASNRWWPGLELNQ